MSLCLTAAGITVALTLTRFTLAWTHSVERTEWREMWRVEEKILVLEQAMVKGSGAGMEAPSGAWLEDGFWRWRSNIRSRRIVMSDAGLGLPWRLCSEDVCVAVTKIVPGRGRTLVLEPCAAPGVPLSVFPSEMQDRWSNEPR